MSSRYPLSDHYDGKRFVDPTGATNKTVGQVLRFLFSRGWAVWPAALTNGRYVVPPPPSAGVIAATYIGQSTVLVQTDDVAFVTDPVLSRCAGPFGRLGPKRVRPPGIALNDLPRLDFALVSHSHYDHLDIPTLRALTAAGARRFVTGLGNKPYLERRGVRPVTELDWWESVELDDGVRITFVPALHWSNRNMFDRNRTLWGGFVVETKSATIYFAGDTGYYAAYFEQIAARFPNIDLALLPIGAYAPRAFMASQHMNPAEAVNVHRIVRPQASMAIHFGTFRLTPEPIDEPVEGLRQALAEQGVDPASFRALDFGETMEVKTGGDAAVRVRSAPSSIEPEAEVAASG